ncbi:MAG: CinA family protein [Bacteroidaceae bacterium]|nr:CinA family protein [Bacteroidaceae bacterium]
MDAELKALAREVNARLRELGLTLSTAESCTGGTVAAAVTSVPGSSAVFKGAVVAYSNDVKHAALGVPLEVIEKNGAVSSAVVEAMVTGARLLTGSDCAVATSGIAGPGGATAGKPVGTVWVAVDVCGSVSTHLLQLKDEGREINICTSAKKVLSLLLNRVNKVCIRQ